MGDELKTSVSGTLSTSHPEKSVYFKIRPSQQGIRKPGKKTFVFQVSYLLSLLRSSSTFVSLYPQEIHTVEFLLTLTKAF